jgi:FKBP-type peptidyl-prolyl cis-trans isomerase 2
MSKRHGPEQRIQIARIDVFVDGDHHLAGRRIVTDHAVQRLPDMRLVDFFHLDHADLAHRDAVKRDFDDAGNVALIA